MMCSSHERATAKIMNLDEAQQKRVAAWVAEGLKLSEIQNRMATELGIRMTYMDVRLLVDDLRLTLKDVEPPQSSSIAMTAEVRPPPQSANQAKPAATGPAEPAPPSGNVSITVDEIARPDSVVSGKVTFSDGNKADWFIDQTGRLGMVPKNADYRPPAGDIQQFQMALESELSKMGL